MAIVFVSVKLLLKSFIVTPLDIVQHLMIKQWLRCIQ